jgi:DNA-binding CsgD family transcriptional regulator/tetratricopeptide (TPR) repeat protein
MAATGLVERDAALGGISPVLDVARQGRTSALFVLGDAGLGKSAVLAQAVSAAAGFEVFAAFGERVDVTLPFGYLMPALSQAGGPDLLAPEFDLPAQERPAAAWSRLRHWLEQPRRAPMLFALDDMHWADPDSLSLLHLVIRHIRAVPLAVVATMRSWPAPASEMASVLAEDGLAGLVRLAPLSPPAAVALASRLTGRGDHAALGVQVQDWCAGNPLLIHQLASSLREDGEVPTLTGPEAPGVRLLLSRFTGLDTAGLDFARAAAVCGVQFSPPIAGAVAGLSDDQIRAALAGLCGAGLLRETGEHAAASFVHALVRQALYDDLPAPLRGQMHAAAFRLLWDRGVPAGEAAPHALAAGLVGDPAALRATEQAATEALACGARDAAGRWLAGALRLAGERAKPVVRLRLARALHACGDPGRAVEVCRALLAAGEVDAPWVAEVHQLLGRTLFELGDNARAEESLRHAAACAVATNRALAIESLVEGSALSLYMSGPRRSLEFAEDADRLLDDDTDPGLAGSVLAVRGQARVLMADPRGATDVASGLAMLPRGSAIRGLHGSATWGPGLMQLQMAKCSERFDEALASFGAAMAEAECLASPIALSVYGVAHADTLSRLGRLDEARHMLRQAGEELPWLVGRLPWAAVGLAHVAFELDEAAVAEQYCRQIEATIGTDGETLPVLRLWLGRVRADLALQDNDAGSACGLIDRVRLIAERSGTYDPNPVPWGSVAIAAYVRTGRFDDAAAVVKELETTFSTSACRWPRAVAARGRAMLADRSGDGAAAARYFAEAIAWHESLPMPLEQVETLLAQGSFLRRAGAPTRAREVFGRAAAIAAACGARRLERISLEELHVAGGRRPRRLAGELTPVQRRIATVAAAGLTNAEIAGQLLISARTVEHHLTQVYATLGINGRRSLRRALDQTPASSRAPTAVGPNADR